MIKSCYISNFKSLVGLRISLPKFTVLIGLNGAGKTTVLQAFDFLSQLMNGRIDEWLTFRGWDRSDIASKLISTSNINFGSETSSPNGIDSEFWACSFNRKELACLSEVAETWENEVSKEKTFLLSNSSFFAVKA